MAVEPSAEHAHRASGDGERRSPTSWLRISHGALSLTDCVRFVTRPGAGGIATFLGTTRDSFNGRPVLRLEYQAYTALALRQLEGLAQEAHARWDDLRCAVHHRLGIVPVTEPSVIIAVSSPHRGPAFEASRFLIDRLKQSVAIWKLEVYAGGDTDPAQARPAPTAAAGPSAVWKANKEAAGPAPVALGPGAPHASGGVDQGPAAEAGDAAGPGTA